MKRIGFILIIGVAVASTGTVLFWDKLKALLSPVEPLLPATTAAQPIYYASSGGGSSTPAPVEVVRSTIDLTGTAPADAKFGVNYVNGKTFLVDTLGQWQLTTAAIALAPPIVATYQPLALKSGQSEIVDITMAGVLLANHYSIAITTALNGYQQFDINSSVVADNTVRLTIKNETGLLLTLPVITISVLKLN